MKISHKNISNTTVMCIYKFTFPDNSVYIGRTIDFKRRIKNYERAFKIGNGLNILFKRKAQQFDKVTLEVLEEVLYLDHLKSREYYYITQHIGPLLLNIVHTPSKGVNAQKEDVGFSLSQLIKIHKKCLTSRSHSH